MGRSLMATERFHLPLAMWRCQFHLLGGSRRMGAILSVVASAVVVGFIGARKFYWDLSLAAVGGRALLVLAGLQCGLAVLGGCNAIYRAALTDYQSRMIESHRLTPMSNTAVVLGYLFGATLQVTSLMGLVLLAGVVISLIGRIPVGQWLAGNLFLWNGAISLWTLVLFVNMRLEKPFTPIPFLAGISALSMLVAAVPGLGLSLSLYVVVLSFWVMTSMTAVPLAAVLVVAVVNVLFSVFWALAAAKKYRRPDLPALNSARGLLLLVLVMIVSVAGVVAFERITRTSMRQFHDQDLPVVQWIATLVGGLLLAAVPIAGSVKCGVLRTRGTGLRNWADRTAPLAVAVLAGLIVCAVAGLVGREVWTGLVADASRILPPEHRAAAVWGTTIVASFSAVLALRGLFGIGFALFRTPRWLAIPFLLVCWVAPVVADSIRLELAEQWWRDVGHTGQAPRFSWLMSVSPPGAILAAWSRYGACSFGLAVSGLVAGVLLLLGWGAERRLRATTTAGE